MMSALRVGDRVRVRDTVEDFAGRTGEIVDEVPPTFLVRLDEVPRVVHAMTFRDDELELEERKGPRVGVVMSSDLGNDWRPSSHLPESLDPSARLGGGDPLADYLHEKGY